MNLQCKTWGTFTGSPHDFARCISARQSAMFTWSVFHACFILKNLFVDLTTISILSETNFFWGVMVVFQSQLTVLKGLTKSKSNGNGNASTNWHDWHSSKTGWDEPSSEPSRACARNTLGWETKSLHSLLYKLPQNLHVDKFISKMCWANLSHCKCNLRLPVICSAEILQLLNEGTERWPLFGVCSPTLVHQQLHLLVKKINK